MEKERTFVCVTNIPTPYRLYEFEQLYRGMLEHGIIFRVLFLSESEQNRHWECNLEGLTFPYKFIGGIRLPLKNKYQYYGNKFSLDVSSRLNPGVVLELFRNPPDWLWMGGSWYYLTVLLSLVLLKVFRRKGTKVYLWAEGNPEADLMPSELLRYMKRKIFTLYDGFVVPGEKAKEYVNKIVGDKAKIVIFRNFVDEGLYQERVKRHRDNIEALYGKWNLDRKDLIFFIPARLLPSKGVLHFLKNIVDFKDSKFEILIAGEGPQRDEVKEFVAKFLKDRVRILGHKEEEDLLELYAVADVFLLPSLIEAYSLATVEALWAGLPLFISKVVGSLPEVLVPGSNGWLFDPGNSEDIRNKFAELLEMKKEDFHKMGRESLRIANERFSTRNCVEEFVNSICD
jgi:glycosyltransferase involved in cell wall biosynthesis